MPIRSHNEPSEVSEIVNRYIGYGERSKFYTIAALERLSFLIGLKPEAECTPEQWTRIQNTHAELKRLMEKYIAQPMIDTADAQLV